MFASILLKEKKMKVFPLKIKNRNTKNWFLNNTIIYLIKINFYIQIKEVVYIFNILILCIKYVYNNLKFSLSNI